MQGFGPASESLRIAEHYRQMPDGELIELAQDPSALTQVAQDALKQEISSRRLAMPVPDRPPRPEPPPDRPQPDSPYAEERELVVVRTVYSLRDALQVQRLLDVAGIPFYMGREKARGVDEVSSTFGDGVDVKVMRVGYPWAYAALTNYEPKDEPPEENIEWDETVAIRCPRCRSEDVVFKRLRRNTKSRNSPLPPTFHWQCASCGNDWEDDGVAK